MENYKPFKNTIKNRKKFVVGGIYHGNYVYKDDDIIVSTLDFYAELICINVKNNDLRFKCISAAEIKVDENNSTIWDFKLGETIFWDLQDNGETFTRIA